MQRKVGELFMERDMRIDLRVTKNEYDLITEKMQMSKCENMSAYIRKMAIDGMILKLDIPELKEISSLLRYNGNNINQIAKRLNEGGQIYSEDISDIKEKQNEICKMMNDICFKLSKL